MKNELKFSANEIIRECRAYIYQLEKKIYSLEIMINTHNDFNILREKFFKECVDTSDFDKSKKINMTPHDLFEWFKKQLT